MAAALHTGLAGYEVRDSVLRRTRLCELLSGPPVLCTVCTVQPGITHSLTRSGTGFSSPAKHVQAQVHVRQPPRELSVQLPRLSFLLAIALGLSRLSQGLVQSF